MAAKHRQRRCPDHVPPWSGLHPGIPIGSSLGGSLVERGALARLDSTSTQGRLPLAPVAASLGPSWPRCLNQPPPVQSGKLTPPDLTEEVTPNLAHAAPIATPGQPVISWAAVDLACLPGRC